MHNWNDLQLTAICEINAAHWNALGRPDIAGAFKRAAHLTYQSAARWQRPSGELFVVKNRAEPNERLAFEHYSHHTQYNLLPMAMLVIAYQRADESIAERPTPAEVGGYVLDARETFHKVAAAAGGYYVLIDTAADPHYNATGLQRVHRTAVRYPALSDSAAPQRAFGPKDAPAAAITPGIQWLADNGAWLSLADFAGRNDGRRIVDVALEPDITQADEVQFTLQYQLSDGEQSLGQVTERLPPASCDGVVLATSTDIPAEQYRAQFPVLVNDGANDLDTALNPASASVTHTGSTTNISLKTDDPTPPTPTLLDPRVVTHSGYVRQAVIDLSSGSAELTITLEETPQ